MQYVINYKLFFRTFNKEVEDIIKADYVLSYFNGKRNYNIYTQFIRDLRTQVEQNALVTGPIANFDAGGLAVQVDLQSI